ncbi:MAG: NAD(P)-binding domain-containing protein [Candidatus Heimdallarchaeota archaeon]
MKSEDFIINGDLSILQDKVVSVIGYGNQGQAQGLILKDNGINVIMGNIKDASWDQAVKDGFDVYDIEEAVRRSDVALFLVPDEVAPAVYYTKLEPEIKQKAHFILDFASGYNITYGLIKPLSNTDLIMVAPRMIGQGILHLHEQRRGYPVLLGVAQDASGKAWEYTKALAKGIGAISLPGGVGLKSSFDEETMLDLLTEHTGAPITAAAMQAYFEVVTQEYGLSPEAAILELYASGERAETARLMAEIGLFEQLPVHSRTSQYGQLTRTQHYYPKIKEWVREAAAQIWNGQFAREWAADQAAGRVVLNRMLKLARNNNLAKAEDRLYKVLGRRK